MKFLTFCFKFNRLLLILSLVTITSLNSSAQSPLCEDPCPPGPKLTAKIDLCNFNWSGTVNGVPETINEAFFFVFINYRLRTCDGITSIIIDDYVFVENSDWWNNLYFPSGTDVDGTIVGVPNNLQLVSPASISNCKYLPLNAANIDLAITDAINKLVNNVGAQSQGSYEVYFKGSCNSLVGLKFPDGSFFLSGNENGGTDTSFVSSKSTLNQMIPCNDACCKLTYEWRPDERYPLENGETISVLVITSVGGDPEQCQNQPLPNYATSPNALKLYVLNSSTGQYELKTGELLEQLPCELACSKWDVSLPTNSLYLKSDIIKDATSFDLRVNPTLADNFVEISSAQKIEKITFIDLSGRLVKKITQFDGDKIKIDDLKTGYYFIQVFTTKGDVKSIKIKKQ